MYKTQRKRTIIIYPIYIVNIYLFIIMFYTKTDRHTNTLSQKAILLKYSFPTSTTIVFLDFREEPIFFYLDRDSSLGNASSMKVCKMKTFIT